MTANSERLIRVDITTVSEGEGHLFLSPSKPWEKAEYVGSVSLFRLNQATIPLDTIAKAAAWDAAMQGKAGKLGKEIADAVDAIHIPGLNWQAKLDSLVALAASKQKEIAVNPNDPDDPASDHDKCEGCGAVNWNNETWRHDSEYVYCCPKCAPVVESTQDSPSPAPAPSAEAMGLVEDYRDACEENGRYHGTIKSYADSEIGVREKLLSFIASLESEVRRLAEENAGLRAEVEKWKGLAVELARAIDSEHEQQSIVGGDPRAAYERTQKILCEVIDRYPPPKMEKGASHDA